MGSRRRFLAGVGTAATVACAGCLSDDEADRRIDPDWPPDEGAWPSQHYGSRNGRYSPHAAPPRDDPDVAWRADVRDTVFRTVVADDTVFCLTTPPDAPGANVFAFDSNGEERWRETGLDHAGSLDYVDGRLYVGGRPFRALDAESGEELFRTAVPEGAVYSVVERLGTVYAATDGGHVYGIHADTGARKWGTSIGHSPQIAAYEDRALVSSYRGVTQYARGRSWLASVRNRAPGTRASWNLTHRANMVFRPAVVDDTLYRGRAAIRGQTAPLVAHDLAADEERWARTLDEYVFTPAVDGDSSRAYTFARPSGVDVSHGTAYALDAATGETLWSEPLDFRALAPVFAGDIVYLAGTDDDGGRVVALDASDGRVRWERRVPGGLFSHPLALAGERLYVGVAGELVAFE